MVDSRIQLAKDLGATHTLNSSPDSLAGKSMVDAIRALTPGGLGCSHILDTTPSVAVLEMSLESLQKNGQVLQVGVKPVGAKLELDCLQHMVNGRQLKGVIEGDRDPAEAVPELVQWCKDGVLPIERLVREFKVEEYEEGVKKMEDGSVIKCVLVW